MPVYLAWSDTETLLAMLAEAAQVRLSKQLASPALPKMQKGPDIRDIRPFFLPGHSYPFAQSLSSDRATRSHGPSPPAKGRLAANTICIN